ncbi:helicase HerA domain-containing protein [Ornatilinea apprima]|uniref:helicase HerA domain-containing protein n=1 Tax=Ornatilinea apprima TaxID=1134406 RepID=UPI0009461BAE|nr:DUF87 domain-containing protein [Ornatilinea apprima]
MQNEAMYGWIGYVVGGGLKEGLRVRLTVPAESVQEGGFVVAESGDHQFYGLVTDIQLGATDPRFADEQSEARLPGGLAQLLHGQTLYTNLQVMPALMIESPAPGSPGYEEWVKQLDGADPKILPVKTIPAHHAPLRLARAEDVASVFGKPEEKRNFVVGYTREQQHPVCINLEKLVQRSSGIFGATGTGKSFLTRIILSGLINYSKASVLMFDMHNEYAYDDTASDTNLRVPGLQSKFPSRVRVVGLGSTASIRGRRPDFTLQIAERDIQPEDIELLTRELNLKETTSTTLDALHKSFGADWFHEFKQMRAGAVIVDEETGKKIPAPDSVAAWANQEGVNVMAAEGLHNKLRRVFNLPYIVEEPPGNALNDVIQSLKDGKHIVMSFGEHDHDLAYLLVTNLLTRRIRAAWETMVNDFRSGKKEEPRPLVVAVEEAHKLLNREMAAQTTFSTIAREMRKYYVTLLIIDQRPSQIYDEVLSQLGTRISGWLGDDADISAVLSGLAAKDQLRGMLAHLQPAEEVLLLGWGVPMPIPVRTRRYDEQFWKDLLGEKAGVLGGQRTEEDAMRDLGFG